MTEQITGLAEHDARHERVWSILPWYVNGSLKSDEHAEAESHISQCLVCRRELAGLTTLAAMLAIRTREPRCESALERLHERMNAAESGAPAFPWAAAAVLVIVTGLAGIIGLNTGLIGNASKDYKTLGARTVAIHEGDITTARIVFERDVTELQLRELLLAVDAELIDGPTRRGAYTIVMPGARSGGDVHDTLDKLRASKRVLFVEPVVALDRRPGLN